MPRVTIESLAYGGDSVAHLEDGRVAFVPFGCPGDVVDIEILSDKGSFVRARIDDVVAPGPDRVTAPCPYFGECGGCSWQHVAYEEQLRAKTDAVRESLRRIGGIDASAVRECEPSPHLYNYRNKIELVRDSTSDKLTLGYHRAGSDQVVCVERCLLLPRPLERAPGALQGALRYAGGSEVLHISRVGVRSATNTNDTEIALWTEPSGFPRRSVATTVGSALKTTSVVRVLSKPGRTPAARRIAGVEVLSGRGYWRERLGGYMYAVSAPSFFQVNTEAAERLTSTAVEALSVSGRDHALDLFSGVGTFTLPLAASAAHVTAVEVEGTGVRDLRRNLESAHLDAELAPGDVARVVPELGRFDVVLADPPRSGLGAGVIAEIVAARPRAIAYVSCDPTTLGRDIKAFARSGYALVNAWPVDLFPQTWHVETIALLRPAT